MSEPEEKSNNHYVIRRPGTEDLSGIVQVHLTSFTSFFLSFLGQDFLFLLYKNILKDPEGIFLMAECGERVEGFIAGVLHQGNFYRRIAKYEKWSFARAAFLKFLRKPTIAPRLFRALNRPNETKDESVQACLMSIAVLPESENRGVGKHLIDAFCDELAKRDVHSVCLTTDRNDNEKVNRFYQRCGFGVSKSFITPEGRAMYEYIRYIGSPKQS
ncbi:MAG: GNAT family N-acetyltransferase [Syntrophorhabdaceae bacterium]